MYLSKLIEQHGGRWVVNVAEVRAEELNSEGVSGPFLIHAG